MKAIIERDKRCEIDKKFDNLWNKLCREAKLSQMQSMTVAKYLRDIMAMRLHEIESARDMGWLIALIEGEKFGTDVKRGAKRLVRAQKNCVNAINEAYGHGCIDANGFWQSYDGVGIERLKNRLKNYGVDYDTAL
jgi:hypothetical protein